MNATRIDRSQVAAALLSLALIGLLVLRVSDAALSATTTSPGNAFTVATISLSDSGGGAALFSVTDMVPGQSVNDCITVTYNGALAPGVVRVYSDGSMTEGGVGAGTLADELTATIEEGTVVADCSTFVGTATIFSGTLTSFNAVTDYASSAAGTFNPANDGDAQVYRITITLDGAAGDDVAGDSISDLGFVWETSTS